ncbi:iron-containing alcohol dehydrogenase [Halalkalibacter krulwichiae]|uniref:NAD-dependent methanol dehydrogenase n=1 Tax=Halalkalibacter krulwichiae TaxID=199441 RepID=A0A1X9M8I0_9BACI|nr:iron-containing alcohol dehydrogenase [Halalkalibacter krulwichiae]ARK29735.1 NAD-dependent methanol dehydrogenase [Halalkalibacter krulwichiae]
MSTNNSLSGEYRFLPVEQVYFGIGIIDKLTDELNRLGAKKAILITSNSLINSKIVSNIKEQLGERLTSIHCGTSQHVPSQTVFDIASKVKQEEADVLISLGGGTVIDSVKSIALILADGLKGATELKDYSVTFEYPDKVTIPSIKGETLRHIAIPTTLSSAEFSNIAGITDENRKVKELYIDDKLTPVSVFLDPQLTLDTPKWLWSSSGIRALDHAIETIYSKKSQPITTTLALESIKCLSENLRLCYENPLNLEARLKCQMASWQSFFGVTNVMMGLSHGIGHQIGAHGNVPHGITSCIMLPHVMEDALEVTVIPQSLISKALGAEITNKTTEEVASIAPILVNNLIKELNLPTRLSEVGIKKEQFDLIAKDAMGDLVVASSPKPVKGKEDILKLLQKAW